MRKIKRRVFMLGLGSFIVAREIFVGATPVHAAHKVNDFEGIKGCVDNGGRVITPQFVSERKNGICITGEEIRKQPQRNRRCREKMDDPKAWYSVCP